MGKNKKKRKKNNNRNYNSYQNNKKNTNTVSVSQTSKINVNTKKENNFSIEKGILLATLITALLIIVNIMPKANKVEEEPNVNTSLSVSDTEKPSKKDETILFLGDSLLYQYNIEEFFSYYNYKIINKAIDGITAEQISQNLEERVYEHNPDKVFILLGTNDLQIEYTPLETFEHLKNIISGIKNYNENIEIYVLSLLPINTSDNEKIDANIYLHRSNEKINEVNNYLKNYCKKYTNITYINIHDHLIDDNGELKINYTREGLHLTDLGYYHLTMKLLDYLK